MAGSHSDSETDSREQAAGEALGRAPNRAFLLIVLVLGGPLIVGLISVGVFITAVLPGRNQARQETAVAAHTQNAFVQTETVLQAALAHYTPPPYESLAGGADPTSPEAIVLLVKDALERGDLAVFEKLAWTYVARAPYASDYFFDPLTKESFAQEVGARLMSQPWCTSYTITSGSELRLLIFTTDWEPEWYFGEGYAGDSLVFAFQEMGPKRVYITGAFLNGDGSFNHGDEPCR